MTNPRLIYGYDALCGWCYGFIPALTAFAKNHPDVTIEVVPGGLFAGSRARPYNQLVDHITNAFPHVTETTGQAPDDRFWGMIKSPNAPVANSTVPNMAVAMMAKQAPEQAVGFAHRLQEIHFTEAADFNAASTYETLSERHGFPTLDTAAILDATDDSPLIAEAYARSDRLGIRSYPTVQIVHANDTVLTTLPSIYDPAKFETTAMSALARFDASKAKEVVQ